MALTKCEGGEEEDKKVDIVVLNVLLLVLFHGTSPWNREI